MLKVGLIISRNFFPSLELSTAIAFTQSSLANIPGPASENSTPLSKYRKDISPPPTRDQDIKGLKYHFFSRSLKSGLFDLMFSPSFKRSITCSALPYHFRKFPPLCSGCHFID